MHQGTARAPHQLMVCVADNMRSNSTNSLPCFKEWRARMEQQNTKFQFWCNNTDHEIGLIVFSAIN